MRALDPVTVFTLLAAVLGIDARRADIAAAVEPARRQGATLFELRSALNDFELRGEPASSAVTMIARSRSAQSIWRREPSSSATVSSSASTAVRERALGSDLASLGRPTSCMGDLLGIADPDAMSPFPGLIRMLGDGG